MPKSTRRVSFTRTLTFTVTIDTPGRPEETDANMLLIAGGSTGASAPLSLGELLAGSMAHNGSKSYGAGWAVTGASANVESYTTRPQNTALPLGQRVASVTPPAGKEAALGKLFVVTTAGTTANSATEPSWNLTDGSTTTDGTVTYRTIPKFPTITTFALTALTVGQIVRPSATSMKEYLVTAAGTPTAAPTWTSNDSMGASIALTGGGTLLCITDCATYGFNTVYGLGDVVKPNAASSQEYLCTQAGVSDASTALSAASVGSTVTTGTAVFKRII